MSPGRDEAPAGLSLDQPGEDHLLAAAYLSRVAEPGSVAVALLVQELGYLGAAEAIRSAQAPDEVLRATQARRDSADAAADLDAA
ncbi:MAG: DNA-protecting protein DprA, partial [Frankiales bacterium]|nr:DNA-protecting protein DprA [Frankiales bacterium]